VKRGKNAKTPKKQRRKEYRGPLLSFVVAFEEGSIRESPSSLGIAHLSLNCMAIVMSLP
jgi:hypothetical protein